MDSTVQNIFVVGAGNHPVFPTGAMIAHVAFKAGFDVKNTSVIGLGVIGGAIASQVRFGSHVYSPLIEKGKTDILLSFDKLESLRNLDQLSPTGTLITSSDIVPPTSVSGGIEEPYTGSYETYFSHYCQTHLTVDNQSKHLKKFPHHSLLWGYFSALYTFEDKHWENVIAHMFGKEQSISLLRGFYLGKELAQQELKSKNYCIGNVCS